MKVLLAGCAPAARRLVALALRDDGIRVLTASDGAAMASRLRAVAPDIIVVDPGPLGVTIAGLCRMLTAAPDAALLLLDAAKDEDGGGTSDEGSRPVEVMSRDASPAALIERIRRMLRHGAGRAGDKRLGLGHLELDPVRRVATICGDAVRLRAKEFDLLLAFVSHPGRVLHREELLITVWGYQAPGKTRTVDVHVGHLRGRLAGSGLTIVTHRGAGYALVAELHEPVPTIVAAMEDRRGIPSVR